MKNRLLMVSKRRLPHLLSFILISLIILSSCEGEGSPGESELIQKINAVHEQMMVQGNINEEEKLALISLASLVATDEDFTSSEDLKNAIPFNEVEQIPVYPGCGNLSSEAARECFQKQIDQLFAAEFNNQIAKDLGITETKTVEVFFKVDEAGKTFNRKVRDANVAIQAEIVRVLKLMPDFKPGVENGNVVEVMCSAVITYGG